jgi:hypothetical protein
VRGHNKILLKLLFGCLFIIVEQNPSISGTNNEISPSDKELFVALSSNESATATKALEKIFKEGERMVPMLISCRGNRSLYRGYNLGDKKSANLIYFPDREGAAATHVSIEVTALYLLEAIFREDMEFADSPYLYDHTKSHKQSLNSDAAIRRAWSSVSHWFILLNKKGMDFLRKKKMNPLFKSKTSFWGS